MNSSTARVNVDPVTVAVAQILEHRAVIEQAKGVLMAVYNIDADAAFDLLKCSSQHTNTKLRVLAEQLMAEFRSTSLKAAMKGRVTTEAGPRFASSPPNAAPSRLPTGEGTW